jgi:branched-chain amino acid transport system permease protein
LTGVPAALAIVTTVCAVALLAVITELVAFRPVRGASPTTMLVTSFAVTILLQNVVVLVFGARPRSAEFMSSFAESVTIAGIKVSKLDLLTIGVSAALVAGLAFFLQRTSLGVQIRAAASNFKVARLLGVRANRVIGVAFGASGILAAAVAVLDLARTGSAFPTVGLQPVLIAFVATVLGGLGSLIGAAAAGFLLGCLLVVLQVTLPAGAQSYSEAMLYGIVIFVLLVRPRGFVGKAERT